jgi:hypothetical protein
MIPISNISDLQVDDVQQPSQTYKINAATSTVAGYIDGIDAVKQSVELIMSTERFAYPIYSWNYGIELESLIGKDFEYVSAEIKRRIKEALIQDDRITDVSNFKYVNQGDELLVEFEIESNYGKFDSKTVVNI